MGLNASCISDDCRPCDKGSEDRTLKFAPYASKDDQVQPVSATALPAYTQSKINAQPAPTAAESKLEEQAKARAEELDRLEAQRRVEEEKEQKRAAEELQEHERLRLEAEAQRRMDDQRRAADEADRFLEMERINKEKEAAQNATETESWQKALREKAKKRESERKQLAESERKLAELTQLEEEKPSVQIVFKFAAGEDRSTIAFRKNIFYTHSAGIDFEKQMHGDLKVRVKEVGDYATALGVEQGWLLESINGMDLSKMPYQKVIRLLKESMEAL